MTLTTGSLAKKANVNLQTILYYERQGLIPAPHRTQAGYRQYPEDTLARIRFIKRTQRLGFTLKEIGEILALRIDDEGTCTSVEEKAHTKIRLIDQKIEEMHSIRRALKRLVEFCEKQ